MKEPNETRPGDRLITIGDWTFRMSKFSGYMWPIDQPSKMIVYVEGLPSLEIEGKALEAFLGLIDKEGWKVENYG